MDKTIILKEKFFPATFSCDDADLAITTKDIQTACPECNTSLTGVYLGIPALSEDDWQVISVTIVCKCGYCISDR